MTGTHVSTLAVRSTATGYVGGLSRGAETAPYLFRDGNNRESVTAVAHRTGAARSRPTAVEAPDRNGRAAGGVRR
jgi:hypothetical protein